MFTINNQLLFWNQQLGPHINCKGRGSDNNHGEHFRVMYLTLYPEMGTRHGVEALGTRLRNRCLMVSILLTDGNPMTSHGAPFVHTSFYVINLNCLKKDTQACPKHGNVTQHIVPISGNQLTYLTIRRSLSRELNAKLWC